MEELDEQLMKEKKLMNLFKQVAGLIDHLEQYLVHDMEEDEVKALEKKIEKYLGTIKNMLKRDEKFFKKHVKEFIERDRLSKKEVKELPKLSHEAVSDINKLIDAINELLRKPNEGLIDWIGDLVKSIEKLMKEKIDLASKLE